MKHHERSSSLALTLPPPPAIRPKKNAKKAKPVKPAKLVARKHK